MFHTSGLIDPAALSGVLPHQPASLFNAADLIDPQVLAGIPSVQPAPAADISFAPHLSTSESAEAPAPMLNAADLFDPAVLADLSLPGGKSNSDDEAGQASEGWLLDTPEAPEPPSNAGTRQRTSNPPTNPPAPPFISLPPLAAPVPPPRPSAPLRSQPLRSQPLPPASGRAARPRAMDDPDDREMVPQRGWSVVPPAQPASRPRGRPTTRPHPVYPPAAPYPMPAAPIDPGPLLERPARQRQILWTLTGWFSLLLVLAIIGAAIAFGAMRYSQLQALQASVSQATSGPLPTIAPKPGYTIYTDRALGYSLQYPTSWQKQADQDKSDAQYKGDRFNISANAALEVGTSPQYQNWDQAQIDDYVLNAGLGIANFSSASPSVSTASTIAIDGLAWTPENATITLTDGTSLTMTSLAVNHNGKGYVIFYFAGPQVFSNYDAQYFEPILVSFRFLDG